MKDYTITNKINTIDLFAGCGGLLEGFEKEGTYETLACVEWEKAPCDNLRNRLASKWGYKDAEQVVMRFDIQKTNELFTGYKDDEEYGSHKGLDQLVGDKKVNVIVGGPPCQAYSLAGRIRDANSMRDDYRNYLFESYLKVVQRYKPNFFIFENVQGMLSAAPDGTPIVDKIRGSFENAGYKVISDFRSAILDLSEYGVPQNRKRIIILGINKEIYEHKADCIINEFYDAILPKLKCKKTTVMESIGSLPKLYPLEEPISKVGKKYSHSFAQDETITNHIPRFHNKRDISIFKMLSEDIELGKNVYSSTEELKKLYREMTGRNSNVHKYYVLRWNEQSNTIPAHLYKDGLRHIHPDPIQARSITVREAARLQSFDDDYEFIGGMMHQFKMIGNAVPPKFSLVLAKALKEVITKYGLGG
ncbi:MAG: DNA cytosine methyltransferase [Clostridiaceae bacterium]|nr:DNA cytosine methyltransferase [Clostridiaceae bacterium]